MTPDEALVARVLASRRYRNIDPAMVRRLVTEELERGGRDDEVAQRVRRRLHQAVGAFSGAGGRREGELLRAAWSGDLHAEAFRDACRRAMASHASTRERIGNLDRFYRTIWAACGVPAGAILDLGCGLGPFALPWMGLGRDVRYHAMDVDTRALALVAELFAVTGQAGDTTAVDLAGASTDDLPEAEVALLLKLVPTLDRQASGAAARLLTGLRARHAVISFPARSLGGRTKGMARTYRARMEELAAASGRATSIVEASVPNELVFVLELASRG